MRHFFYFINIIPYFILQLMFNADINSKKMNVICKFVIGYFLGIYFFLTLQRIVEKLLPFYILIFTQYAKSEYTSVSPFDISNTCGCYFRLFISGAQGDGWYERSRVYCSYQFFHFSWEMGLWSAWNCRKGIQWRKFGEGIFGDSHNMAFQ